VSAHTRAVVGVLKRDAVTFASYPVVMVGQAFALFLSLTLFYYISRLVRFESIGSADDYFAFVVVGLVALQVLNSTLQSPPDLLRGELVAGSFERFLVSPFGPIAGALSMMLFPFMVSVAMGAVMIGLADVVYGLDVRWGTAALALPVSALGALAFACFGLALVAAVVMVKQAGSGTTWVVAGISIVAGLYFPVAVLPDWIEWAAYIQPFTPAVDLMRNVLLGTPMDGSAWVAAAKVAGFATVLLPLAAWLLSLAIRAARRRGTILEY
jgi:ABC-2 type transport system permease protein